MRVTYDRGADAVYIYLSEKPYSHGRQLDEDRRIDYDASGMPRGVELLAVSGGVILDQLPECDKIAAELERLKIPVYA